MEIHNKLEERFYNETFANPTDVRKLGFRVDGDGNALGIRQPKHHEVLVSTCTRFYLNSISL